MLYQKQERIWTSTEIIVSLPIRLCESILGDISSPTPGGVMIFMNSFIYPFSNKREKSTFKLYEGEKTPCLLNKLVCDKYFLSVLSSVLQQLLTRGACEL